MDQAISLLKERLAKAEAKESRAEKALESAKNDTERLRTTLEVLLDLQSESGGESGSGANSAAMASRHSTILALLQIGEEAAQAPAEIYQGYRLVGDDISIDTFRTTIWRMKDNTFTDMLGSWMVKGDNGKYWREPVSMGARESAAKPPLAAANPFAEPATPPMPKQTPWDDDDEHPF